MDDAGTSTDGGRKKFEVAVGGFQGAQSHSSYLARGKQISGMEFGSLELGVCIVATDTGIVLPYGLNLFCQALTNNSSTIQTTSATRLAAEIAL